MRTKSLAFLFCLVLALCAAFTLGAPQVSQASPESDAATQWVSNVVDTVNAYHVDGMFMERGDLIKGAVDGAIKHIEGLDGIAENDRETVLDFLRTHEFKSIAQLLHVLDRFSSESAALDFPALENACANGAIGVLNDPFTRVMGMDEIQRMQSMMQNGEDKSIGIVPMRADDGSLEIGHVRWNFWGFHHGIRAHDKLIAVNGTPVEEIADFQAALQADQGAMVTVTIKREGFDNPITISGRQGSTQHPVAVGAMLPGKIGYIRTDMFSMDMHTEVQARADELAKLGMVALILDLRNNPGGAMPACTGLADLFLPQGEVITTTKGRYENPLGGLADMLGQGQGGTKIDDETTVFYAEQPERYADLPLVLLVNGMSASASEMFCGSMRAHGRAELVGTQTYGKGVGQTVVPIGGMGSMFGNPFGGGGQSNVRVLYMTVMTYFLPDGSAVQHIGVPPTIDTDAIDVDAKLFDKLAALRATGVIAEYVNGVIDLHSDFFAAQLNGTGAPFAKYPMIDELKANEALKGIADAVVARELRREIAVRLITADVDSHFFNATDDNQLQTAILAACTKALVDPTAIPEYAGFAK